MRRSQKGQPFTLFSFQDIMTSVCGIVVLITLLLALELTRRSLDEEEISFESNARRVQEIRKETEERRQAIKALEETQILSVQTTDPTGLSAAELQERMDRVESRLESARNERARLQKELDEAKKVVDSNEDVQKKIDELREERKRNEETIKAAQAKAKEPLDANVVLFSYYESAREKPWFVDISGSKIIAIPTIEGEETQEFPDPYEFLQWARRRSRTREYFVLVSRPSGAAANDVLSYQLEDIGFKIGLDLIGEDRALEFMAVQEPKGAKR